MMEDPDPFDLFDESDAESDEVDHEIGGAQEAQLLASELVRQANANKVNSGYVAPIEKEQAGPNHADSFSISFDEGDFSKIERLKWDKPDYLGPILIVKSGSDIGGGRQVVASKDIGPGTLLLLEKPVASWSTEDNHLDMNFIRMVFDTCSNVEQMLHWTEDLHPRKVDVDKPNDMLDVSDVDQIKRMMEKLDEEYREDDELETIVKQISDHKICNADGSPFCRTDLLRFLLAMRYNALESGLYMYTAMLNHSDMPNCVKFKGGERSEVRSTRSIVKGEMLTISYIPRILSHASRRRHLWNQHRFDIGTDLASDLKQMELVAGQIPHSAVEEESPDSLTFRIESTLQDLSSHVEELEQSPKVDSNQAIALELSSMELFNAAIEQLQNENHLLLLPCLKLHVDSCALVQKSSSLSPSYRLKLLERLVVSANKLLKLQKLYHGTDHFDVARTELDLAEAIGELLSRSPSKLIGLHLEGIETTTKWASYLNELRKDYTRIKALYEMVISI